jgi:hypothetical protein
MNDVFEASNELEQQLVAAQEGRIREEGFIEMLLDSQVFMPVRDSIGIEGFQGSDRAVPLTVQAEDDTEVLVLFTSLEHAKSFVRDYPGFEGGLLVEFRWILEKMGTGFGISLNPGLPVGLDLEAAVVEQIARGTLQASAPHP